VITGRAESDLELLLIELEYAMAEWRLEFASLLRTGGPDDAKRWRSKMSAANYALEIALLLLSDGSTRREDADARFN
jgi:hypothetical protein